MKFCVFWVWVKNKCNISCNILFRKSLSILYFMTIIRFSYIITKHDVFGAWFNTCLRPCFIVVEFVCLMIVPSELKFVKKRKYFGLLSKLTFLFRCSIFILKVLFDINFLIAGSTLPRISLCKTRHRNKTNILFEFQNGRALK